MNKNTNKKMFYLFIGCMVLSMLIIGGTYAYFTAKATDDETIKGNAATVSFGLEVERVTTVDMAFGLVPMKNNQAPGAANKKCLDDFDNAGCQMYRIKVKADSDTVMFLDGYVETTPKENVETRIARIYTDDEEETFYTGFNSEDFQNEIELKNEYILSNDKNDLGIKTGSCVNGESKLYNHTEDANCFFVDNEKIGGDEGREKIFYMMIWVYDDGKAQDVLQGMQMAYTGVVTFTTAEGNQISATFD